MKNQILDRAKNHTHDVVPTQVQVDAFVETRKAERANSDLIHDKKIAKGKTSIPVAGNGY